MSRFFPVKDFPWYLACDEGYLINADTGAVIYGSKKKSGYVDVCLRDADGEPHYFLMHRIIAEAFCEKSDGTTEVNHIDGNKSNNCATNLEWVRHGDNLKHAYKTGLRNDDVSPKVVIATNIETGEQIIFKSIYSAARFLNVSQGNICMCCKGIRPHASGYTWEYQGGKNDDE